MTSHCPLTAGAAVTAAMSVGNVVPRGAGRSYGDSALGEHLLSSEHLDHLLSFDPATGVLECSGGTRLDQILAVFVPQGWFLPVTPGTKFVTVGGAIASDVHGKNHHADGCFSRYVDDVELILGNGERVRASRETLPHLFHATCGGMGLTGFIVTARLRLKAIASSNILETTIKTPNLEATIEAFEDNASASYSVAWIDCLSSGEALGRSLLMLGEHAQDGVLSAATGRSRLAVPVDMPAVLLNRATVSTFNALYFHRVRQAVSNRVVHFDPFFYPLDALDDWNRLYGRAGFLQYQFVIPKEAGVKGLRSILERIAGSGRGSFLAVLKLFGEHNDNMLSFPMRGYTLALDFKAEQPVFDLLNELDPLVADLGGRLYLAKDARMSASMFKQGYPRWDEFEAVREAFHAVPRFHSDQSRRLGLK